MRVAVLPCSKEKRWDVEPDAGPVAAARAYVSPLHLAAQAYAARHADAWVVLSALHGFLRPDDLVPAAYDVTFSRPGDPVISAERLAQQAQELGLTGVELLLIACPDDYADRVRAAVGEVPVALPLAGIPLDDLAGMTARLASLHKRLA